MNIHLKVFFCIHVFFLAAKYLGVELLNRIVSAYLILKEIAKVLSQALMSFYAVSTILSS